MPIPNLYSVWVDPVFYIAVVIFVLALVLLVYSVKKYIEMENKVEFSAEVAGADNIISSNANQSPEVSGAEHAVASPQPQSQNLSADAGMSEVENIKEVAQVSPQNKTSHEQSERSESKAEIFLKGIHNKLLSLDERLKNIETVLAKDKSNVNFTIDYLQDIIEKIEEIDKEKIKTRLEYLISNFLKH